MLLRENPDLKNAKEQVVKVTVEQETQIPLAALFEA